MPQRLVWALATSVFTSSAIAAEAVFIEHSPVGCVVAERFPRLEAEATPIYCPSSLHDKEVTWAIRDEP
jgi:hypothetical protein